MDEATVQDEDQQVSDTTTPRNPAATGDSTGRVLREVLRLALPNIMASASVTLMHFVDVTMVSRVGKAELAAVSNAGVIVFALFALAGGIAGCVNTFASQSLGRGRHRECSSYAWQNAFFGIAVGLAALPLVGLAPGFFAWVGHAPDVQARMVDYAQVRLCGLGFGVCVWGFCSYFQGIHRPWVSMATTIVANAFNIAANYALIFGRWGFPALGIRGAAIGTVAALVFQSMLLIGFATHPRFARTFGGWDTCRLHWVRLRRLLHIGWPAGVTLFLEIGSWAVFNNALIGRFGTNALAGNTAAVQYMQLSFMVALGLSHATTALTGRYVGMGDIRRAKQRAYAALAVAAAFMLAMAVVFYTLRYPLARHFSRDPGVVEIAATILVFAAIFQGFRALGVISGGALRGAGDTRYTALVSVAYSWGVFLPLGFVLVHAAPGLGPAGPWIGGTVYISLLGATLFYRLVSEGWAKIDIFRLKGRGQETTRVPS